MPGKTTRLSPLNQVLYSYGWKKKFDQQIYKYLACVLPKGGSGVMGECRGKEGKSGSGGAINPVAGGGGVSGTGSKDSPTSGIGSGQGGVGSGSQGGSGNKPAKGSQSKGEASLDKNDSGSAPESCGEQGKRHSVA